MKLKRPQMLVPAIISAVMAGFLVWVAMIPGNLAPSIAWGVAATMALMSLGYFMLVD